MEEYYNSTPKLGNLKSEDRKITESRYLKIFDIKDNMIAVRFKDGTCGIVDYKGKVLIQLSMCDQMEFLENDFLKVSGEQNLWIDLRSKAAYSCFPELKRYGDFELLYAGGFIYTRTRKLYEVHENTFSPCLAPNGLYLTLPCDKIPVVEDGDIAIDVEKWIKDRFHAVCLLTGDNSQRYWLYRKMKDGSVIVMDDYARFYYVAVKNINEERVVAATKCIGNGETLEDKTNLINTINALELRIDRRMEKLEKYIKIKAERFRLLRHKMWCNALPFKVGNKWGLRQGQHILVPPRFRSVMSPVGKYCAVEMSPMNWGIIDMDGKMVVQPKYEEVSISMNGIAELTIYKGKSIKVKLD